MMSHSLSGLTDIAVPECSREVPTKQRVMNHFSKVHPDCWQEFQSDKDGLGYELNV